MRNDIIDAAMDRAEEEIADKMVEEPADTEAPEIDSDTPEAEPTEADDTPTEEAGDKPIPDSKDGEAASQDAPAKEEESKDTLAPTPEGAPDQANTVDAPQFWDAKDKALFAKAAPEVRAAIAKYEQQRNDWAYKVQADADRGKQIEKRATEVFEPYRLKLQAQGLRNPLDAAERLLAWNEIFEKDPLTGIKDLMQKNGLTPTDLSQSDQDWQPTDPRLDQALAAAEEAKRIAEEQRTQFETQQQQIVLTEIERFKQGKDSYGHTRKAFTEMYAPQITQAVEEIQKQRPGLGLTEALGYAYDFVKQQSMQALGVSSNGLTIPQKPASVDIKKAQAAASSVKGSPGGEAVMKKKKARTIDEAFAMAEEQLGIR